MKKLMTILSLTVALMSSGSAFAGAHDGARVSANTWSSMRLARSG